MLRKRRMFVAGRHTGPITPYKFKIANMRLNVKTNKREGVVGWEIRYGISGFLVAGGSAWSLPEGRALYRLLEADYWGRKPARKGGRKVLKRGVEPGPT